jgi:hypothetical protein
VYTGIILLSVAALILAAQVPLKASGGSALVSIPNLRAQTVFIVGAGFSRHAGLPLTSGFTEAMLEAREFRGGPSRLMVEYLCRFIRDTFDHSTRTAGKNWPALEDVFTCVDLSANSGHHFGSTFAPADLRTVRRAMLCRIIRMLDQKYEAARKQKGQEWKKLDDFFGRIDPLRVGFISMNWDTVIERKLASTQNPLIDYCCDALHAGIPEPPEPDDFRSTRKYLKALGEGQVITLATLPVERKRAEASTLIVKIHGSANWLYCDNCRQLYWFAPHESRRVADQLIRRDDLARILALLPEKRKLAEEAIWRQQQFPQVMCLCSDKVALGTRIATFSYRKALDFPMFQKSWLAAEELLRFAKRWVFIGYSLPAADYEFKYLLKRTQLSRAQQPELIVISGGTPRDVRETFDNYRGLFGRRISELNCFSEGLTQDAVTASCGR